MGFIANMFSPPRPQMPPLPPLPVAPTDPAAEAAAQEAAEKERKAAALAQGRSSTILTGGQGDTSEAPVTKRTLLGEGGYAYAT